MTEHAPDLDATQARQGLLARRVYKVLLVSLALVVVAFLVLWVAYFRALSGHGGQTSAPPDTGRSSVAAAAGNAPSGGAQVGA
jgi:hypothetical protein